MRLINQYMTRFILKKVRDIKVTPSQCNSYLLNMHGSRLMLGLEFLADEFESFLFFVCANSR